MISFLLLLLLLSHSSGEPFYVTNGAMIHQCHPASTAYVSKFDVNKMSCADRIWKQVTVTVDYWCDKNTLKRTWRLTTNLNEPTPWPSHISLNSVYGKDVKQTTSNINTNGKSETIQEGDQPFVASQAQMVSFMWSKPRGLQCRLKYNLPQDLCTAKAGKKFTAKLTELVCYYGPKDYNVVDQGQRDVFTKFLDDASRSNSNANSSTTASSQTDGIASQSSETTTFQKYKLYIFGAAGVIGLLVVLTAVFVAIRRGKPSNRVTPTRMSVESDFETMTAPSSETA